MLLSNALYIISKHASESESLLGGIHVRESLRVRRKVYSCMV